jgi:hypothetical protein
VSSSILARLVRIASPRAIRYATRGYLSSTGVSKARGRSVRGATRCQVSRCQGGSTERTGQNGGAGLGPSAGGSVGASAVLAGGHTSEGWKDMLLPEMGREQKPARRSCSVLTPSSLSRNLRGAGGAWREVRHPHAGQREPGTTRLRSCSPGRWESQATSRWCGTRASRTGR